MDYIYNCNIIILTNTMIMLTIQIIHCVKVLIAKLCAQCSRWQAEKDKIALLDFICKEI